MVINLRGTSGSGKSTLVRRVMDEYPVKTPVHIHGRKQPIAYLLDNREVNEVTFTPADLAVLGHYETPCGGCDTITKGFDEVYRLIREYGQQARHVIYEGVLLHSEVRRTVELAEEIGYENVLVVALDVPLEECLDGINQRRWARDPNKPPVDPHHTAQKHKAVFGGLKRLEAAGVPTALVSREEAFNIIMERVLL